MQVSKYVIRIVLALMLVQMFAFGYEKGDATPVRQAIEAQNAKFAKAFNRADAAGVAAIYTENARSLPPNAEMAEGRKAIEKQYSSDIAMGLKDLRLRTVSVEVNGNTAHEVGTYTITIEPEGKKAMKDSGKYLAIWKKQADGSWLIDVVIWNSSLPLPGM